MPVHVTIGPAPSDSAMAYIDLCHRRLAELYGNTEPAADVALRRPFRIALTNGILNALEAEGKASGELARELRENWPDDDLE
jgi:hypothetical protein